VNVEQPLVMQACHRLAQARASVAAASPSSARERAGPGPGAAAYRREAALNQLARSPRSEWAKDGIRIQLVHPNQVFDTGLWTEDVLAARARPIT